MALASATASSASRTLVTVRVGPKVSSRIARASSGTSTSTVGSTYGGRTASGAAEHRPAAAGQRVVDVPADDVELAGHGDRAEVGVVAAA